MVEIPEDVMDIARRCWNKKLPGQSWGKAGPSVEDIALAIMADRAERERDKWEPIASAPKDGTRILAVHENGSDIQITWFGKTSHVPLYGWCEGEDAEDIDLWHPTHWQPLPIPPGASE